MKFARVLFILVAALLATPVLMSVPVLAAQVIGTAQDMVIEVSQGHLVRIDRAASVVFVANSNIAEVAVKSPHLIFVVGKKPGVTTLYAVDQNENVVANLRLVVTHPLTELQEALKSVIPSPVSSDH
jgi:pilus assembly protein CpaC